MHLIGVMVGIDVGEHENPHALTQLKGGVRSLQHTAETTRHVEESKTRISVDRMLENMSLVRSE